MLGPSVAHGDFILITPGVSGEPPHDTKVIVFEEDALGPLFVPPGSGHLQSETSFPAIASSSSSAFRRKDPESAFKSGRR